MLDAASYPWHRLQFQDTSALRTLLGEKFAPATGNRMLAAVRGAVKASWRLGLIDAETYKRTVDFGAIRGHREPKGRALTFGEVSALVQACRADDTAAGKRDLALLAVLWAGGLRRAEVVGLDVEAFTRETGALRVLGKGNKERLVYLTHGAGAALVSWLKARGSEPGPLFWATRKGGGLVQRRLTDRAVFVILRKLAKRAGVDEFGPHDLRRTFASDMIGAGADLVVVQKLMGHSSVTTTARYDRRGEEAKAKASDLRHFPFRAS